ncbi:hypothetical protein EUTSA_v10001196mg, partial [Eutrema salsugineum]
EPVVEAAVLNNVCWLDVSGNFDTKGLLLGKKIYTAYGWNRDWAPVKLKLVVLKCSETPQEHIVSLVEYIGKQWIDISAGEFMMSKENLGDITFLLYEQLSMMPICGGQGL